jgi:UDP-glucose:(heptosyl)LPS alpha-1,3-glucosyltransferase
LRLAVVSPFVDRSHGTERALAELLELLATRFGYNIYLYAQRVDDLPIATSVQNTKPDGGSIHWRRVPSVPGPHVLQFVAWLVLNHFCRRWDRIIRGLRFDLVFSPGINCLDADVILIHAVFHRLAELRSGTGRGFRATHRRLYYRLLRFLERRIYTDPNVTLAGVSQHTAAQIARYFHRMDVAVIPNGVDTKVFNPEARARRRSVVREFWSLAGQEKVVLLIGNDWQNKGLPVLLEAAAQCVDIPLRLLVIGEEDPSPWEARASQLGLAGRAMFLPPDGEVMDLFAAADIYVAPSLEDSFNLPALEAMACGLTVIVSTRAGVSEWIRDGVNGVVLQDPENAAELASILRRIAGDPLFVQRLGVTAAETAATLSWDRHAEMVHELLEKGARAKSRPA